MEPVVLAEESDARNYLDQADRGGDTALRRGQILWCIDNAEHHFTEREYSPSPPGGEVFSLLTATDYCRLFSCAKHVIQVVPCCSGDEGEPALLQREHRRPARDVPHHHSTQPGRRRQGERAGWERGQGPGGWARERAGGRWREGGLQSGKEGGSGAGAAGWMGGGPLISWRRNIGPRRSTRDYFSRLWVPFPASYAVGISLLSSNTARCLLSFGGRSGLLVVRQCPLWTAGHLISVM